MKVVTFRWLGLQSEKLAEWQVTTATGTLADYLKAAGVVGISGIDTRTLVRHIRTQGAMNGVVSSEILEEEKLVQIAREAPKLDGEIL